LLGLGAALVGGYFSKHIIGDESWASGIGICSGLGAGYLGTKLWKKQTLEFGVAGGNQYKLEYDAVANVDRDRMADKLTLAFQLRV
jgi:hypothetical protein